MMLNESVWNFVWLCISYMMILKLNFGVWQDEITY